MYNFDRCYFASESVARRRLYELEKIAHDYGCVTVADYYETCFYDDYPCKYTDNKYGWLEDTICNTRVASDYLNRWYIDLPRAIPLGCDDCDTPVKPTLPDPDILNITIHTNELKNPDKFIADIFKHIPSIKDRMINFTIM